MGRKPKYKFGTKTITISINKEIVDYIRDKAEKQDVNFSEFCSRLIEASVMKNSDYHRLMAKKHARMMYYHQSEAKIAEEMGE